MDSVRPYEPGDRDACLDLFDSNVPVFFDVSEREGFAEFLDEMRWPYQVIVRDGRIVACGGHAVEADGVTAALCWGMVDGRLHGEGLGRRLTEARLAAARAVRGVTAVRLDTSQHTEGFYRRFGFTVEAVTTDGFSPGIDKYEMRLVFGDDGGR
ncbi:MAG: GNAT family N-acetyltransferase [Brevundimonas sp.]|uniref:GNAT family N-acetyltransferase n=1 Tax=Brevundimonas sp. TaxID=1871086 RepID=UPI004034DCF0